MSHLLGRQWESPCGQTMSCLVGAWTESHGNSCHNTVVFHTFAGVILQEHCNYNVVIYGGWSVPKPPVLFSAKIICMVKFYIQMTRSLLFAWWFSTYKWYSYLHGEVLHTNESSTYKWYNLFAWWSSIYTRMKVLHTNEKFYMQITLPWQMISFVSFTMTLSYIFALTWNHSLFHL